MANDSPDTTDRQTRAIHMLATLEGYEGSDAAASRTSAWNYYLQRPRGDEVEGRSPVVSGDVSAMTESTLAQVSEALSTDRLAEFEGTSDEDERQAQLEGAVVSAKVMSGKGWFRLASAVKNALLLRMGVVSPAVVDCKETTIKALQNVDSIAHAVMEAQGIKFEEYDPDAMTAKVQVTEEYQKLELRCVNAENFLFMKWPLDDFENIPACAERHITTRQFLIDSEDVSEEKADSITASTQPHKSDDAAHSLRTANLQPLAISSREQLIEWYALFYLYDGKRYRAIVAGNKIATEAVVSKRPPYCIGVPFINPGHIDGFSVYDKTRSTQDVNTALQRMLTDNANAVTMNRLAVIEGSCDSDQLTDQDPSGVLQVRASKARGDIRNAVMPIQTQDLTAGLVTSLTYMRTVRAEMAGASLEVGTGQVQLPDRMGSMGLDRAYSASEQLSSLMLKTISESMIKDLWLLCHELLRSEWRGALDVKVEGRWLQMEPSKWPRRKGVVVKPGMSPGERQRRSSALGNLITLQGSLAEKGMEDVLVNAERYYRTVCDWARLNDITRPEQYLIDPSSDEAKQALERKGRQAQEQARQAQQLQQMAVQLEAMKTAVQKYGIDVKAGVDVYKIDKDSETDEAKLVTGLVQSREASERQVAAAGVPSSPGKGAANGAGAAATH